MVWPTAVAPLTLTDADKCNWVHNKFAHGRLSGLSLACMKVLEKECLLKSVQCVDYRCDYGGKKSGRGKD